MNKERTLEDLERIDREVGRLVEKRYRLILAYNRAFSADQLPQKFIFTPASVDIHNQLSFNQSPKGRLK